MIPNEITLYLLIVFCAHLLGDFLLQTDAMARKKGQLAMFLSHVLIHAGLVAALLLPWVPPWRLGFAVVVESALAILVLHGLIDYAKLQMERRGWMSPLCLFSVDQLAHVLSLVGVATMVATRLPDAQSSGHMMAANVLALIAGFVVAVFASGHVVGMITQPFTKEMDLENRGLKDAGALIGKLERVLVYLMVVSGYATGVGFLIAAKSIFRFGRTEDESIRKESEYIIVGTLASFALAVLTAVLVMQGLRLLAPHGP